MTEFLTSQQTADALRVNRATVHRWVSKGLLRPAQVVEQRKSDAGKSRKVYLFDAALVGELAARQRSA